MADAKTPQGPLDEWAVNFDAPGNAIKNVRNQLGNVVAIQGFDMDFDRTVTLTAATGKTSETVHVHIRVDQNGFVDTSPELAFRGA